MPSSAASSVVLLQDVALRRARAVGQRAARAGRARGSARRPALAAARARGGRRRSRWRRRCRTLVMSWLRVAGARDEPGRCASSVPVTMAGPPMADGLSIREVAEQTGLAPGTIRMWEQRHGFPSPRRTASGYRRYDADDVETLRRARAHRQRGLSVQRRPRARARDRRRLRPPVDLRRGGGDRPRRPAAGPAQVDADRAVARHRARAAGPRRRAGAVRRLPARALLPRARAALPPAGAPRRRRDRVRRLRRRCAGPSGAPVEVPIAEGAALANEWAVIVDAPGYAACLLAWEQPGRDRARQARRPRSALRGDLDHRPARDPARGAGGRAAGRPRRRGVRRAGSRSCWPTARWRWSSRRPRSRR